MINKIKNKIDSELANFFENIDRVYSLSKISGVLYANIKDFVLRKGKRIRPILFIIGYKGFAKRQAPGLYTSALAIELLHDFMLVHDDIIDKSETRRGKPSMHAMLNNHLTGFKDNKFNGQDLSIVVGDIMYALAIDAFLAIKENPIRKETALRKFVRAAVYTGSGEFIELLYGLKPLDKITKNDIYKIYDYKTAHYTFSTPLATGAILAGAKNTEINKLYQYGIYLGRAFQIKDDILGIFEDEKKIGKSTLTDLQEAKKTLLIWYAYNRVNKNDKEFIKMIFSKKLINRNDLKMVQELIKKSGALSRLENEISQLTQKAQEILAATKIHPTYYRILSKLPQEILQL